MGVPVVGIAGDTFAARHSASHLAVVGLADWVAASVEEYVARAAAWAGRRQDLATLRAGLRDRLKQTTLGDGAAFTRDLEAAYEAMWREASVGSTADRKGSSALEISASSATKCR
jgi:predicted O-linked N-acetylglucosamine transferase (SPINDLY family)